MEHRTLSAVRLFQGYVRTIEGDSAIGTADGIAGKNTFLRIDKWFNNGITADWTPADDMQSKIFSGLNQIRDQLAQSPDPAIKALDESVRPSSTRKLADWQFDPGDIHLLGIRRDNTNVVLKKNKYVRRNDDIFVLLVNGIRIVFRGSTDPSPSMAGRKDAAFLIRGQHEYRFGWHKISTVGSDTVKVYRAFNLLVDLVTVFSKDIRCGSSDTLLCTLLYEKDLASAPDSAGINFKQLVAELS